MNIGFEDGIPLSASVNWEQLLEFALHHYNMCDQPHFVCERIIVTYVINELSQEEKECSDEAIEQRFRELVVNYILHSLYQKGYVEASIDDNNETVYQINEEKLDGSENT